MKLRIHILSLRNLRLSHLFSVFTEKVSHKALLYRNVGTFREVTTQGVTFSERPEGRALKALSLR